MTPHKDFSLRHTVLSRQIVERHGPEEPPFVGMVLEEHCSGPPNRRLRYETGFYWTQAEALAAATVLLREKIDYCGCPTCRIANPARFRRRARSPEQGA
jgi:hypothetical protein